MSRVPGDSQVPVYPLLAMVYWSGRSEVKLMIPKLIEKLSDRSEDVDVRMAAATAHVDDRRNIDERDDRCHRGGGALE